MMRIPKVVAHRGYQRRYPENTVTAIRAAIDGGVKFVEIDVQLTADHAPVLLHDESLQRMCGVDRPICEVHSDELSQFHAAETGRLGDEFATEPLATLKQCSEILRSNPDVQMFVELKDTAAIHASDELVVDRVLLDLDSVLDQCIFISFRQALLHEIQRKSESRIGPVIEDWSQRDVIREFEERPYVLFCNIEGLPTSGELSLGETQLAVYEVPDANLAMELAGRGVNLVETFAACDLLMDLNSFTKNTA